MFESDRNGQEQYKLPSLFSLWSSSLLLLLMSNSKDGHNHNHPRHLGFLTRTCARTHAHTEKIIIIIILDYWGECYNNG